ncbi:MAG TPA: cytochrome c3 family protein [Holophagaceae bacterium]|nr:cytochrome c3 family protein [Holophagaceae bacterium]
MQVRTAIITAFLGCALAAFVVGTTVDVRLLGDNSGYQPAQPLAFSHRLHAGENRIDCLFCHSPAEKGRHGGIPPVSTCLKCHETIKNKPGTKEPSPEIAKLQEAVRTGRPIEWVRIHRNPSFVYFNHSRHVNAGVACQTCHGEVQTMDGIAQARSFSMGDCLNCHRAENQKLVAAGKQPAAPTDCSACHH